MNLEVSFRQEILDHAGIWSRVMQRRGFDATFTLITAAMLAFSPLMGILLSPQTPYWNYYLVEIPWQLALATTACVHASPRKYLLIGVLMLISFAIIQYPLILYDVRVVDPPENWILLHAIVWGAVCIVAAKVVRPEYQRLEELRQRERDRRQRRR